jgi:hypothetical protein
MSGDAGEGMDEEGRAVAMICSYRRGQCERR